MGAPGIFLPELMDLVLHLSGEQEPLNCFLDSSQKKLVHVLLSVHGGKEDLGLPILSSCKIVSRGGLCRCNQSEDLEATSLGWTLNPVVSVFITQKRRYKDTEEKAM